MIRRIVLVGFQLFFYTVRIDIHLQLQLQVHKKLFHYTKYPDFGPSSLATIDTWKAGTWYALLCYIDLEPQKTSSNGFDLRNAQFALGIKTVKSLLFFASQIVARRRFFYFHRESASFRCNSATTTAPHSRWRVLTTRGWRTARTRRLKRILRRVPFPCSCTRSSTTLRCKLTQRAAGRPLAN